MQNENLENKKIKVIDSNLKVSENPFEIQNYEVLANKKNIVKNKKVVNKLNLKLLKKNNFKVKKTKSIKKDIYFDLEIFSKSPAFIPLLKYYIFPLDDKIKNDQSEIYEKLYQFFLKSLKNVFINYKKFNKKFIVKFDQGLIFFDQEIKATLNLAMHLKVSDIKFSKTANKELLLINDNPNMIIDILSNYNIRKNSYMPFILSYSEFEYSIVKTINIIKGPVIKNLNENEFTYKIKGPLFIDDLKIEEEWKINIK